MKGNRICLSVIIHEWLSPLWRKYNLLDGFVIIVIDESMVTNDEAQHKLIACYPIKDKIIIIQYQQKKT